MGSRLDGHSIVITGAGSGIGRATALRATADGAIVAGIDSDEGGLDSTARNVRSLGGRFESWVADVGDREALTTALEAAVSRFGPLHGVLANAGVLPAPLPVESIDWQQWDRVLAVNLTGATLTLVSSLPHVVTGGSLVACGSSMAIRPRGHRLAYVASKAGLHAVARALALEVADRRIRVNVLAPGLTDTPMVQSIPGHVESGLPSVPLGETIPAEEVAELAVYLLSGDSRHVTGAVFSIDGGRTAG